MIKKTLNSTSDHTQPIKSQTPPKNNKHKQNRPTFEFQQTSNP